MLVSPGPASLRLAAAVSQYYNTTHTYNEEHNADRGVGSKNFASMRKRNYDTDLRRNSLIML